MPDAEPAACRGTSSSGQYALRKSWSAQEAARAKADEQEREQARRQEKAAKEWMERAMAVGAVATSCR
jgi:hypothetical protein